MRKQKSFVVLSNGEVVYFSELNKFVPFSIINNSYVLVQVTQIVLEEIGNVRSSNDLYPVYFNVLKSKSNYLKCITAVVLLSKVKRVCAIQAEIFPLKCLDMVVGNPELSVTNCNSLVTKDLKKEAILKFVANSVFRFAGKIVRKRPFDLAYNSVIRSWVDVDRELHQNEFRNSYVFIYPFGLNLLRSLSFIKDCYKSKVNFELVGVEYSIKDLLNVILATSDTLLDYFCLYEFNAFKRHSKKFVDFSIVYTSDEFQVAAPILYSSIKASSVNRCHGVGRYNVINYYDEMSVLTMTQLSYYQKYSPTIKFNKSDLFVLKSNRIQNNIRKKGKLVYLDQGDFRRLNYFFEHTLSGKVLDIITRFVQNRGLKGYVKFHPNRSYFGRKEILKLGLEEYNLDEADEHDIYVNLYSTSLYDERFLGSFVHVSSELFDPSLILDLKEEKIVDVMNLELFLKETL